MISKTYHVPSNKSSNIGSMSSPRTKQKICFTPQSSSSTPLESTEEYSTPLSARSKTFPQKSIEEESDEEYEGLGVRKENRDVTEFSFKNNNRKNSSSCFYSQYSEIIKTLSDLKKKNNKRKLTCIDNSSLSEHQHKLHNILSDSSLEISKDFFKRKSISSFSLQIDEHELESLSSTEDISNFYEYTKNCFKTMVELENISKITKCTPLSFPFDNDIGPNRRLAVFDLDETLIHCMVKNIDESQHIIEVTLPSRKKGKIGLNVRPHWKEALDAIKDQYQIVVYTASHKSYCDAILDYIDPDSRYFKYRLYRNNCTSLKYENNDMYIKDLSIFKNIDLKHIVIIDNSVISFTYNLDNGIPILPYYDAFNDNELIFLSGYLNRIFDYDDLREANKKFVKMDYYKTKALEKKKSQREQSFSLMSTRANSKKDDSESDNDNEIRRSRKRAPSIFSSELQGTFEDLKNLSIKNK